MTKYISLFSLMLILAFSLAPQSVLAQQGDEETEKAEEAEKAEKAEKETSSDSDDESAKESSIRESFFWMRSIK